MYEGEKTTIEIDVDLSNWLNYSNIEKALPKIKLIFDNKKCVTDLLQKIQKEVEKEVRKSETVSDSLLPDVDPASDFLLLADRMELLLPRTEPLRNFVAIQKGKSEVVRLWLVRDLRELIPKEWIKFIY